jgi:hypothetical protein
MVNLTDNPTRPITSTTSRTVPDKEFSAGQTEKDEYRETRPVGSVEDFGIPFQ